MLRSIERCLITILLETTGGLFTRIGLMAKMCRMFNGSVNGVAPSNASAWGSGGPTIINYGTLTDAIEDQYEAALQAQIANLYPTLESFRKSGQSLKSYMQTLAQNTLIEMAHADTPLAAKTTANALALLISQMTGVETVNANTVSAGNASAGGSNVGNAVVMASVVGPNGINREYVFPETLTAKCTNDALLSATAGSEPIAITGVLGESDPLSYLWPKGSNVNKTITLASNATDGTATSTTQHMLTNSDFETWTNTNTLSNFTVTVGAYGTSILRSSTVRKGTYSLSILGDGSEVTSLYQLFNDATGTLSILKPSKVYAFSAWVRMSTTPAAGVMAFELTDGSGTVLADDAGTNNAISQALTAVSTSFVNVRGFFRTKTTFSGVARLRIRLTTAITNTHTLYIDDMHMCEATELYTGGPFVAAFRGTTNILKNDTWTISIANDMSAAGTAGGILQTAFEQFFGMRALGLQLPSNTSAGESVPDSLAQ